MAMPPFAYVILLGLGLILLARFLPKASSVGAASPKTAVQEIEETIEHFAAELDEQNQVMLDLFTKTKHDYEVELAKLAGRLESLERQKNELSKELLQQAQPEVADEQLMKAEAAASNPQSEANPDFSSSMNPNSSPPVMVVEEIVAVPEPEPVYVGLSMRTRYEELFSLHDQGKSVEAIAKKTEHE